LADARGNSTSTWKLIMRYTIIAVCLLVLSGCTGLAGSPMRLSTAPQTELRAATDTQILTAMQYKSYDTDQIYAEAVTRGLIAEDEVEYIKHNDLFIGMTENALHGSRGYGHKVNKTVTRDGTYKEYVYGTKIGSRKFVYVENGLVSAWKDYDDQEPAVQYKSQQYKGSRHKSTNPTSIQVPN
jgi:hypothetical protein